MILIPITVALLCVLTLSAYADRIYSESGKFLAREYQDNIDSWVERIEPGFGLSRDSISLSVAILRLLSVAALSLTFGRLGLQRSGVLPFLEALLEITLGVVLFDRLVPQLLFARTRGTWVSRLRWVYQAMLYALLPVTLLLGLLLSIASLAEHDGEDAPESQEEGVDALLEAGEEEGILEESDRALVRSVVEFGDMTVREVMTPRPQIVAVADTATLAEFTEQLNRSNFSRVPVYSGSLDNITGIAFAHDLLQISDTDAAYRTVREMQRPAAFTPEPKKVNELLREMRAEKQHMRVVIDEYGTVAGLVTIEDLIEAIVGNIEDEHETEAEYAGVERESRDSVVVPGDLDLADLRDLFNDDADEEERATLRLPPELEATTVGGLVSELAGHIPRPGEIVQQDGLRLEVLSSTARLVTRVRVQRASEATVD